MSMRKSDIELVRASYMARRIIQSIPGLSELDAMISQEANTMKKWNFSNKPRIPLIEMAGLTAIREVIRSAGAAEDPVGSVSALSLRPAWLFFHAFGWVHRERINEIIKHLSHEDSEKIALVMRYNAKDVMGD